MRLGRLAIVVSACLGLAGCGTFGSDQNPGAPRPEDTIVVGVSGDFAENQLVAEMYAQVLENAGYTINRELDIADRELGDQALESGEIDLKPEYTGFELGFWDPDATTNGEPEEVASALQEAAAERGLTTYAISPANSTNVFVTLPATAE